VITRNKFIDRLKKHLRHHEKETLPWDDETARAMSATAEIDVEATASLRAAIRDLPAEEQQVLDGVYRHGKTYEEVSQDTGLPLGTMKRRLRGALATLRRRMVGETK
jgi:RNA polymerase sigma-70 factor (ECF subfamily)